MKASYGSTLFVCISVMAFPAFAQHAGHGAHDAHAEHSNRAAKPSNSNEAFEEVNAKMHRDMAIQFTGEADVDFVRGMIPHHQGAIDMAVVLLQYGSDPEIKKLAQDIIDAQKKEIAWMKDWLANKGK